MSNARKNIKNAIEAAEEDRRKKLLSQRLEIARAGIVAYQKRRIAEAVKSFQLYLRILEEVKNAPEGGLDPSYFDIKNDLPELLVISGVYWDLAKLFDRTQSAEKQREFSHYLQKYILFSKDLPYQSVCAETLRKYIANEKTVHTEEFRIAYRMLGGSQCFIATALMDVTQVETLPKLQRFRDQVLIQSKVGRAFVAAYYRLGPTLARQVLAYPLWIRKGLGKFLDRLAKRL